MLIYVSGPYTANTIQEIENNVGQAIDAGIQIMLKGHEVIVPHLSHYLDIRAKKQNVTLTWEDFMNSDIEIVKRCDAILFLSNSKGADIELDTALKSGLKKFNKVSEIPVNNRKC